MRLVSRVVAPMARFMLFNWAKTIADFGLRISDLKNKAI